ncbi:MAG: GspH/FimT family pseudopilin [Lautropia sp.]
MPFPTARRTAAVARRSGFTLIELLVALVIGAIIVSLVAVSGGPNPARAFRQEAERLAQLLSLAREEAQVRGAPIRFVSDASEYRFVIFKDRQWRPLEGDQLLRPRAWEAPTRVELVRADGLDVLEFGREMVDPPFRVRLRREGLDEEIAANGLGSFDVLDQR